MANLETISLEIKANANGVGKEISSLSSSLRALGKAVNSSSSNLHRCTNALTSTASGAREANGQAKKLGGTLNQIGRIAKTLLIRTVLRSLIKGFQQSWQAAYQFSKNLGGSFAQAVDATRTMIADTTTTIVQTFAPVLEALVPVIYTITQAIQWLCNQLQTLFNLLGMTSDLFGKNVQNINKYYGSTNKASKANKNLLASWDELNVIQSKNGGAGGSGSGYNPGALKSLVGSEINGIMQIIVGEGMLALGLILACTGHIGLGIGCMLIGASAIAKTVTTDWNKLPNDVRSTIVKITTIVGVASLALGAILLCTNHIGLGIGLLAIGAANMVASQVANDNGELIVSNIRRMFARITAIAGISLIALGAILCCFPSKIPLGIAMIAAGCTSLFASETLSEGGLVSVIKGIWEDIEDVVTGVWNTIKDTANSAWSAISEWWNTNIGSKITAAWESISEFFNNLFGSTEVPGSIADFVNTAWETVSAWWDENIYGNIKAAWDSVLTFFSTLFGDSDTDGSIAHWAKVAWDDVSTAFTGVIATIEDAWKSVATWFNDNITVPIENTFIDMINGIIEGLNFVISKLNSIAGTNISLITKLTRKYTSSDINNLTKNVGYGTSDANGSIMKEKYMKDWERTHKASGAYGISPGEIFVANEHGAELVGEMAGKTTVANQQQIVEGIASGVRDANAEQNRLLAQQNELLRGILDKEWSVEPSASWGKHNQKSAEMWAMVTGR